jgi:hypothetical protein
LICGFLIFFSSPDIATPLSSLGLQKSSKDAFKKVEEVVSARGGAAAVVRGNAIAAVFPQTAIYGVVCRAVPILKCCQTYVRANADLFHKE